MTTKTAKPRKPRYLHDGIRLFQQTGQPDRKDYVRAWNVGGSRNGEIIVQVWLGKEKPEGQPDGDWAMPAQLSVPVCVAQAVIQTTPGLHRFWKFKVLIRLASGAERWEEFEKRMGEANTIRGHGKQPEFKGDIEAWGRAIIDWFNKDAPDTGKRTFVRAEMIEC